MGPTFNAKEGEKSGRRKGKKGKVKGDEVPQLTFLATLLYPMVLFVVTY